ncbi:elongation factor 4 [Candidatus Nomurabacteria bacterium RIFCSPHIGHO2_01_FULL_39_220]|uniref:Elongation factor 4 n=1 Tax=Candidatus Nomurabacteria bacterium RIFCSPLOWO2_02_FULL_40_67 TaxID=1801787 RepID=A0A1F6Y622_9BACT|nr:MAG: GTP-binding protein LepA [Parcubacteria group bacterium GW2011_GWA2_40_37]KKS16264.1 MAG: GTP-binding protein LepA [Parcubacteria group bacterium GW2011_GWB1_41_6]KKS70986.1 MAG: GTP-binding protein LepA [Parcubacteria group bacterium GW2011_GWF2_42_7]OGI63244.1 MAG: elongation factor 4 [Candidatus Nomurabacteria bacterium RBG_16_40_11]OGI70771.1 MAG: elongation factor 4 [Candidatus Nomurabacteria bacterium RIFCSPHIGHO2_01_FULL_39_220]OGI73568.1 MAG: elongation factor 4 [Candidatus Nom
MNLKNIRNFSIIAHIDHGKSTLADRMLEITHTVEARKMRDQVLDSMELERERGITIKMQPVRMEYTPSQPSPKGKGQAPSLWGRAGDEVYVLNLIDTPGHVDFSYEVSRALKAVEGSILLVDSTQGVQAQTLTVLSAARGEGQEEAKKIISVITKIDSPLARISEVKEEVIKLLNCRADEILEISGRTGEGVENLLKEIIQRVPPPRTSQSEVRPTNPSDLFRPQDILQALVFDFKYSNHRGVIVFVRVFHGEIKKGDNLIFAVSGEKFIALEVGTFSPEETARENLSGGEIGYIVTGIKKPGIASVGDTVTKYQNPSKALPGYMKPVPVVWASIFPEDADDFAELKLSLGKLSLSDSSFSYEEESSGSLGKGFRAGFLGMLHLEIITERLRREFNLNLVITTPSIIYEIINNNNQKQKIYSPYFFPDDGNIKTVLEPWVTAKIITPVSYLGNIMQILFDHEAEVGETENFGLNKSEGFVGQTEQGSVLGDNKVLLSVSMPLRELMRNFFNELKSVSSGYASISYNLIASREADVTRLDILAADEIVPAFSKVISKKRVEEEAKKSVEKLKAILPRQMFTLKIQGKAFGRIISSATLSGMKKDVTAHMYGGDITRKMKLREKQKKGKKKMKERGRVNIPQEVFLKMMRSGEN